MQQEGFGSSERWIDDSSLVGTYFPLLLSSQLVSTI